jgi:hypothetical protein
VHHMGEASAACPHAGYCEQRLRKVSVCLLPLTIGARQQEVNPFLAFQHRTISAVVLSSRLVVWGTSGQVIIAIQPALPEAWLSR